LPLFTLSATTDRVGGVVVGEGFDDEIIARKMAEAIEMRTLIVATPLGVIRQFMLPSLPAL
jgi:hypothetical protein